MVDRDRTGIATALTLHTAPQGLLARALGRRLRPPLGQRVWIPLLAVATLAVGVAVGRWSATEPSAAGVAAIEPTSDAVPVRLVCVQQGAASAAVAGSWNGWDPSAAPMVQVADGVFAATVLLERGRHEYMYVVDGRSWTTDLAAATWIDDGFGNRNAVIDL